MKAILCLLIGAVGVLSLVQRSAEPMAASDPSIAPQRPGKQPLAFTKNMGQWDEQVLFRANAGGVTTWFAAAGGYCRLTRRILQSGDPLRHSREGGNRGNPGAPVPMQLAHGDAKQSPEVTKGTPTTGNLTEAPCGYCS